MNVASLNFGMALVRGELDADTGSNPMGIAARVLPFGIRAGPAEVNNSRTGPADPLKSFAGNRMDPPVQGGRIEQPRMLASDRMEQLNAEISEDDVKGSMTLSLKFQKALEQAA